ncbi:MAG: nucleoside 2-deoxyribosyltransferase domain-containing protein [Patescibacteria group bacterium]
MKVVYAFEEAPESYAKSLFLAGPTPRDEKTLSWRSGALRLLESAGYNGVVFIPEAKNGAWRDDYDGQIEWEDKHLNMADCILFWVPRDLVSMPAFTTNVEWGTWHKSGKCVLGAPPDATKMSYFLHYAKKLGIPSSDSLAGVIKLALAMLGDGSPRNGGEREVPLRIWRTEYFQSWYQSQKNAGNRLDGARVVCTFSFGQKKKVLFFWTLQTNIFVKNENRNKTNEIVVARPDISSVLLYRRGKTLRETEVVLVREFRSPAATSDGNVRELPGGSASKPGMSDGENAVEELREETGFTMDPSRLKMHASRQLAATLSLHKAHLFSAEITAEELAWFKTQKDVVHGDNELSERTYVEVRTVKELLGSGDLDWTTIGMALSVLR